MNSAAIDLDKTIWRMGGFDSPNLHGGIGSERAQHAEHTSRDDEGFAKTKHQGSLTPNSIVLYICQII
jgi:hypothetical protein